MDNEYSYKYNYSLSEAAKKIAAEKPEYWEYLFFSQVLKEELGKRMDLRLNEFINKPHGKASWGSLYSNNDAETIRDSLEKIKEYRSTLFDFIDVKIPEALRNLKASGDVSEITALAAELGILYQQVLEWRIVINMPAYHRSLIDLVAKTANISALIINDLDDLPVRINDEIMNTMNLPAKERNEKDVSIKLIHNQKDHYGYIANTLSSLNQYIQEKKKSFKENAILITTIIILSITLLFLKTDAVTTIAIIILLIAAVAAYYFFRIAFFIIQLITYGIFYGNGDNQSSKTSSIACVSDHQNQPN